MKPTAVVEVMGTRLHYREEGGGEPVLLLHGVNGGASMWEAALRALSPRVRAIAPDLPGWGDTPPPPGFGYTMNDLVRFFFALMDRMGLERVRLVGWSLGGTLAVRMAHERPDRVRSLALVAPGALDASAHWSFRIMALPGIGEWLMRPTPANIRAGLDALTFAPRALPEEVESYLFRVGRNPWFRRTTLRWIRRNRVLLEGARRVTVRHLLGEIRCPTRVLFGEADPLVSLAQANFARSIPGAEITLLPRCGHLPMWEQQELFRIWLLESVAERNGSSGRSAGEGYSNAATSAILDLE
ncbi:MAG: alpha/beta fold hydrolase [Bacillota bacterium]